MGEFVVVSNCPQADADPAPVPMFLAGREPLPLDVPVSNTAVSIGSGVGPLPPPDYGRDLLRERQP
jgi:hypothetical protein